MHQYKRVWRQLRPKHRQFFPDQTALIDVIEKFPAPSGEPLEVVAFDLRNNEPLDLESMHRIRAACQDR